MPTYEYKCENCGHQFEQFQTITAKPLRVCPECGKKKLNRLIGTGSGIIFKGSGFYQTDYRSESYRQAAKSDKKTTTKSTDKKSTETKAKDSKPVEKSASSKKEDKKTT